MARKCSICFSKQRTDIETALLDGTPFRLIAQRFGTSAAALCRHQADHLPATLVQAKQAAEVARAGGLLDHVRLLADRTEDLYQQATDILRDAKEGGDSRTALAAIREAAAATREARGHLELLGKLSGELENGGGRTVNIESLIILPTLADEPVHPPTVNATVVEVQALPTAEE
jgi:hypothetical protein